MNYFHYAFKVKDIESTRKFYIDILNCNEGRSTENWIDFNFFGHQLSAHVSDNISELDFCGKVDNLEVPIPHFGCIISIEEFKNLQEKFDSAHIKYLVRPYKRYEGKVGEQYTLFVFDYSNNPLEFKAFTNPEDVFAS